MCVSLSSLVIYAEIDKRTYSLFFMALVMPRGRKVKERVVCIDTDQLVCSCMWPLKLPKKELRQLEQIILERDELQALAYKDLEDMTMQEAADKMGISKTVFAGIYTRARYKQTDCLVNGKILLVACSSHE